MKTTYDTREAWLEALVSDLRPVFAERNHPLPDAIRVAIGFPYLSRRGEVLGECWTSRASADAHTEIFISPLLGDAETIARIMVHELCHAAVGCEHGHDATFAMVGRALDLEGKPKRMLGGATQWVWLAPIVENLGNIPHAALKDMDRGGEKKQSTRMLKVECPCCGFVFRTSAKWLEGKAELRCPDMECGEIITLE